MPEDTNISDHSKDDQNEYQGNHPRQAGQPKHEQQGRQSEQEHRQQQGRAQRRSQLTTRTGESPNNSEDILTRRRLLIGSGCVATLGGGWYFLLRDGGDDLYEGNAEDYILSIDEIRRIVDADLGATEDNLAGAEGVDSGLTYNFRPRISQEDPLKGYTLIVAESMDYADTFYEGISDRPGSAQEADFGDKAITHAIGGETTLTIQITNIVVDIVATQALDYIKMERIAEEQIKKL
jgi:hypothetical protein